MELTKEYFDKQLKSLATKNDVNVINQRIDSLPTHKDLAKFATKADLKSLATKNELNEINNDVADLKKFVQRNMVTKKELDDLRDELPTRADFNTLQQSVDGISSQFQAQRREQIIAASRGERMEAWIIKAAEKIGVEYKP